MTAHPSKQRRFVDWLTEHKASFPKLEFREDTEGCGSVYTSADIADDEVFLTIPFSPLVLTDALARKQLPDSVQSLDGRTTLMLFLIQQSILKEDSFFQPYLDMIPDKIHTALEFDEEDLEQLRGTNAYLTVRDLKLNLRTKYDRTMRIVGDQLKIEDGYIWEKFLWAETVVSSRAFPAHLFGGGIEGESVLIPLGDTLNHKSRHKVTWIKTQHGLEMSGGSINKGEQVFNNYGPKDNLDDLVTLKTNFSRDPDEERKTDILKHVGITEETIHYLRQDIIPDQLFIAMRVMAMNPAEVDHCFDLMEQQKEQGKEGTEQTLEMNKEKIALALSKELRFVGFRNEFAMIDLMDLLLGSKLKGIMDWDTKLSPPQNQAQRFAQIYRRGQKKILESCADLNRGMFSVLLKESRSGDIDLEKAAFIGNRPHQEEQQHDAEQKRRLESSDTYSSSYYKTMALQESRSMSELKQEAVQQVLMTAEAIMAEYRDDVFGQALVAAFPGHGWGEDGPDDDDDTEDSEMAMQMEQDAILTCFLIFESRWPGRFKRFITAAKKFDYSSQLDEDMVDDVQDLRHSLQETLEETDPEKFDFKSVFTSKAFVWATGMLETLSLSLHINGTLITGVFAPRDAAVSGSGIENEK
ncbi:hypothetical protein BGX28_001326 [Mortierella sp. GBA30]|nr:hypothetical protein BGX28_001326 [Mortierella sp. GBA30]